MVLEKLSVEQLQYMEKQAIGIPGVVGSLERPIEVPRYSADSSSYNHYLQRFARILRETADQRNLSDATRLFCIASKDFYYNLLREDTILDFQKLLKDRSKKESRELIQCIDRAPTTDTIYGLDLFWSDKLPLFESDIQVVLGGYEGLVEIDKTEYGEFFIKGFIQT